MGYTIVLFDYLAWHYGIGVKEYLKAWMNIQWFWYHFFSMPVLLKSYFKPFHRMQEGYGRGFDPGKYFEVFVVNLIMRVVGAAIRSVFLVAGVLAELVTFILGILFFALFIVSPVAIPVGIFLAVLLLAGL